MELYKLSSENINHLRFRLMNHLNETETDSTNGLNPARTDWGLNSCAGTRTQPKPRLGLKPMVLS